jgi:DNA-binding phage protein
MTEPPAHVDLMLRLQVLAVLILQRRAKERAQTDAEVVEGLLWDAVKINEARAVAEESTASLPFMPADWRERLRQAVRASGKTQSAIAREVDMTQESVSRILSAHHVRPSFETVAKIAHASGVSVGWILREPGFVLTDEQRAKIRTAGMVLVNLTGGMPK